MLVREFDYFLFEEVIYYGSEAVWASDDIDQKWTRQHCEGQPSDKQPSSNVCQGGVEQSGEVPVRRRQGVRGGARAGIGAAPARAAVPPPAQSRCGGADSRR